ncbi:ectonucleotide pyrophosphatase/phosphodiesterase family member 5-like [Physella acuta]|uniref:ectonucleotide pyrophosphatase/phosphodiesterase family member 5-like n=1 Tax=Physella acuta TaxID=109671 RepID=UPI0027DC519F|nr:ectonucleotide pyrophosphatase/phosphodiesterase family member 5-like [Physella acuta]XP_059153950.1 ectonucleotide pyrophosphatase/phosphodiesterase family member 5-like [Physella acuta]
MHSSNIRLSSLNWKSVSLVMITHLIVWFCAVIQMICHNEKEFSLLLVSLDGFRWDFHLRTDTPNFHKIIKQGVYAKDGLTNVFVTNTLPNHWSMVTGLFVENHGVMDNFIKDPNITTPFIPKFENQHHENDPKYYDAGAEPIWVANQLQKQNGRSGSIMWWGGDNPVKWVRPTLHMSYNEEILFQSRVDTMVSWFKAAHPINLGLLYFHEPDLTAHKFGPNSSEVINQIKYLDSAIGYLLSKFEENDLLDDVNIIITSDHGFTDVSATKTIKLNEILESSDYTILNSGTTSLSTTSIFPAEGHLEEIYKKLKAASEIQNVFKVYKRHEIPEEYHYKNNLRAPPILVVPELGYSFTTNVSSFHLAGNHGYDNKNQEMHPIFLAMGPSFKQGFSVESFSSVDIYPLMCHLLKLQPAPNNGSMKIVGQLLSEGHETTMWTFGTYILVLIVIASVGGIFTVAACRHHRYFKRRILQLRLSPVQATIKYSTPPTGGAKASLLSGEEDDDDFDDAHDDDKMLEIVAEKW